MPPKKEKSPRVGRKTVVLSDYDLHHTSFVNKEGRELLTIDFDRLADGKPQLSVQVIGVDGNLQSSNTLFDLDA